MKNLRIEEKNINKAKIINLKNAFSYYYPCLITVKKVELKAQNFKNKTINQSYSIDFLPNLPGLYLPKTQYYTKKRGFQKFENSDLYAMYNIKGQKRWGPSFYYIKKELKILNKEIFKLRKTNKPLELLPQLFENLWVEDYQSRFTLYEAYAVAGQLYLTKSNHEKGYVFWFTLYLHSWRNFIFNTYKNKIINLSLETLNKYNIYGLCKLQTLLDLSELGYRIPHKNNSLENLFYYIKKESDYKTPLVLEDFKKEQETYFFFNLKNFLEKSEEKNFLKAYIKKYEPNKFEGTPYSWHALYDGFAYLNKLHFLEDYYSIFGVRLKNRYGLSHFGQKHLYLQNYIYTEGPCLTASQELQKMKNFHLAGINLKPNAFFPKLGLEQLSFLNCVRSTDLFL